MLIFPSFILFTQFKVQIYILQRGFFTLLCTGRANGMRYLRWGGDGEAVQPEKW